VGRSGPRILSPRAVGERRRRPDGRPALAAPDRMYLRSAAGCICSRRSRTRHDVRKRNDATKFVHGWSPARSRCRPPRSGRPQFPEGRHRHGEDAASSRCTAPNSLRPSAPPHLRDGTGRARKAFRTMSRQILRETRSRRPSGPTTSGRRIVTSKQIDHVQTRAKHGVPRYWQVFRRPLRICEQWMMEEPLPRSLCVELVRSHHHRRPRSSATVLLSAAPNCRAGIASVPTTISPTPSSRGEYPRASADPPSALIKKQADDVAAEYLPRTASNCSPCDSESR